MCNLEIKIKRCELENLYLDYRAGKVKYEDVMALSIEVDRLLLQKSNKYRQANKNGSMNSWLEVMIKYYSLQLKV
jgi:hypothetical protein